MCGICGVLHFDSERGVDEEALVVMRDSLSHRGPDDAGTWTQGPVGLGHRRLSIIDLSPAGHQPMCNEDGTIWIAFNGEIYNFQELRTELEGRGHHFKSQTDTEVVLHLFEDLGIRCVERLNGMFAFSIWDRRNKRLYLARDRLGIKPLYYSLQGRSLLWGSELKALRAHPEFRPEEDWQSLGLFFSFGYINHPHTAYRDTFKLSPGHWLECTEDGEVTVERYWHLLYDDRGQRRREDYEEELRELLLDAVRIRMVADVPYGAFLSGGVDSSIVVSQMARCLGIPVKTFSIGFQDRAYSDLPYAKAVADHLGTEHHELVLSAPDRDLFARILRNFDEPYSDYSMFPMHAVAQLAREHVTMALSGDGGDELFAGYARYRGDWLDGQLAKLVPTSPLRKVAAVAGRHIPNDRVRRALARLPEIPEMRYYMRKLEYPDRRKQELISPDALEAMGGADCSNVYRRLAEGKEHLGAVTRAQSIDTQCYLPEDILTKVDRTTMMHSLEARVPLLDHRVVELAARIPPRFKITRTSTKVVLREAFEADVPQAFFDRPKTGFRPPLGQWLRTHLRDLAWDMIRTHGDIFKPVELEALGKLVLDSGEEKTRSREFNSFVNVLSYCAWRSS